jgi:hypothetical protein
VSMAARDQGDRLVKPFKLPVGEASTAEPVNGQPIDIRIQYYHPIGLNS